MARPWIESLSPRSAKAFNTIAVLLREKRNPQNIPCRQDSPTSIAPIHAINSDANPTRLETNRKYAARWKVELVPGVGHWPMLEDPAGFGQALMRVLAEHERAVP